MDTTKQELERYILNDMYNSFLERLHEDCRKELYSRGAIFMDFASGKIPIRFVTHPDGSKTVSFAEKRTNDQTRYTTEEEFEKITSIIDEAMQVTMYSGDILKALKLQNEKIKELKGYMNSLEFE